MAEANNLFTESFSSCNSRFAAIFSFREISLLGLPYATTHIYDQSLQYANELFNDPQHDNLFTDKQGLIDEIGGIEGLGAQMTQDQTKAYTASVDAASLVFAHSVIDSAALNYCHCCALANPQDWEKFVAKKKISVEEIKGLSYDDILKKKVNDYINSLDKESLLTKADRLFQVCSPPRDFSPLDNFCYDRDRLLKLDRMRHEIVHKSSTIPLLPNGNDDIWFLQQSDNYLMALVNSKFDLKINPAHFIKTHQQQNT